VYSSLCDLRRGRTPALAALSLPWIEERMLGDFRQLAQQQVRATLRIERPVPLSRRSLLERHWLNVDQIGERRFAEGW